MSLDDDTLRALMHDLRGAQSAILALLRNDVQRRGATSALHQGIEAQVHQTLAVVDDLALLLRAAAACYPLHDVELGEVLHELRDQAQPLAETRGVALSLTFANAAAAGEEHEGHWVRADRRLLAGALSRLLRKAIDRSPQGTTVRMALAGQGARPARRICVALCDRGPELDAEASQQIFAMQPSRGLGLHLVKTIVERHGGTLVCASHPGHGTQFIAELPEAPPEDESVLSNQ